VCWYKYVGVNSSGQVGWLSWLQHPGFVTVLVLVWCVWGVCSQHMCKGGWPVVPLCWCGVEPAVHHCYPVLWLLGGRDRVRTFSILCRSFLGVLGVQAGL
jgi:hypothetical protein